MEINLLKNYPRAKRNLEKRAKKTAKQTEIARRFDKDFFDGDREVGYGGFHYDPKYWEKVVLDFIEHYSLNGRSSILDVGCAKGFMLYDFVQVLATLDITGIDISKYAIDNAKKEIKAYLGVGDAKDLSQFENNEFDLVISINTVHNLPYKQCCTAIQEINRVGKNSFITVDAWNNQEEMQRMYDWNLTAQTMMSVDGWKDLFNKLNYTGDYYWFLP